jgi:hypothetical protein
VGRYHSEDLGIDGNVILNRILGKLGRKVLTGKIGTSGGLL